MKFKTITGSLYEVDLDQKQIRRLAGSINPQPRQGEDGQWKKFEEITPIKVGSSVLIAWSKQTTTLFPGSPEEAFPATLTSPVISIDLI